MPPVWLAPEMRRRAANQSAAGSRTLVGQHSNGRVVLLDERGDDLTHAGDRWADGGDEDRYGTRSTIITSQLPPAQWHDYLADATLADAICDRLLHNTHRIVLKVAMGRRPTHAA